MFKWPIWLMAFAVGINAFVAAWIIIFTDIFPWLSVTSVIFFSIAWFIWRWIEKRL